MNPALIPKPGILKGSVPQDLLFDVQSDVENGDFSKARDACFQALCDGYFDIRLYVYYFFSDLNLQGSIALSDLLDVILTLASRHTSRLQPRENFNMQFNACVRWLFEQTGKLFDEHKRKNSSDPTSFYQLSIDTMDLEQIQTCIEKLEKLAELNSKGKVLHEPGHNTISKITLELKQLSNLISQKAPKEASNDAPEDELIEDIAENEPIEDEPEPAEEDYEGSSDEAASQAPQLDIPPVAFASSNKMDALKGRLQIFSMLIKEGRHLHASVLAKEITELIENFDPVEFFPGLFSEFLALQAKHHAEIVPFWDNQETQGWQCLVKLCKSDIDAFLSWEMDF